MVDIPLTEKELERFHLVLESVYETMDFHGDLIPHGKVVDKVFDCVEKELRKKKYA